MYNILFFLLEKSQEITEEKWYTKLFRELKRQVEDLFHDFRDVFLLIKEHTYDVLSDKFGGTGVALVFIAILLILSMIIITKVIRGNDE